MNSTLHLLTERAGIAKVGLHQMCLCLLSHFSCVWFVVTLWTATCQALLSMESSRQEYWSGLHALLQRLLPDRDWTHVSYVSFIGRRVHYDLRRRNIQRLQCKVPFFLMVLRWALPTLVFFLLLCSVFNSKHHLLYPSSTSYQRDAIDIRAHSQKVVLFFYFPSHLQT